MGLAWQQGPVAPGAIGRFLVPEPLPGRLPYAEPLRWRIRARLGGAWIADSKDVTREAAMIAAMAYLSIGAVRADAVVVSGLRRGDELGAGQVRQAVAAAIGASGCLRGVT